MTNDKQLGPVRVENKIERITLQVSVQIIKHISSGLYRSPASAIKELISNAFDADAPTVEVKFKFKKDNPGGFHIKSVSVEDTGKGIDLDDIYYTFTHIGLSSKTGEGNPDKEVYTEDKKRPVIGRLGIGILSIASACNQFVVRTKKEGNEKEYIAYIDLTYFDELIHATETMDKYSIGNVDIRSVDTGTKKGSYTKVEFSDFKPPFMENIDRDIGDSYAFTVHKGDDEDEELYFRKFLDNAKQKKRITKLQMLDLIALEVGLMSPVEYLSDGPVRSVVTLGDGTKYEVPGTDDPVYLELKERPKKYDFSVYFNIEIEHITEILWSRFKVFKPLRYPLDDDIPDTLEEMKDLDPHVLTFGPIEAKINDGKGNMTETEMRAYLYHQDARIIPHEFRGFLFRVHNVAIGRYFADELRLYSDNPVVLHQTFMEIYLDKGFQSIINLDREGLYEGSNTFRHVLNFLENFLNGRVPVRSNTSRITSTEQNVSDATKEFREKQEDEFTKTERETFKVREGAVTTIKRRMRKKREVKIRKYSPLDYVDQEYQEKFGVPMKIKRLDNFEQDYRVEVKTDTVQAYIPRFEGTRSKLWDSLFASALLTLDSKNPKTRDFLKMLIKLYETNEGRKITQE